MEENILTDKECKKIMLDLAFNKKGDIKEGAKILRHIDALQSQNKQLLETVESLKCCGNCGWDEECCHTTKDPKICKEWYFKAPEKE